MLIQEKNEQYLDILPNLTITFLDIGISDFFHWDDCALVLSAKLYMVVLSQFVYNLTSFKSP